MDHLANRGKRTPFGWCIFRSHAQHPLAEATTLSSVDSSFTPSISGLYTLSQSATASARSAGVPLPDLSCSVIMSCNAWAIAAPASNIFSRSLSRIGAVIRISYPPLLLCFHVYGLAGACCSTAFLPARRLYRDQIRRHNPRS